MRDCNIPCKVKDRLYKIRLADRNIPGQGNKAINIETKPIQVETQDISGIKSLDIMEIGEEKMLLGLNWLKKYNLSINWQVAKVILRQPKAKVAGTQLGQVGQLSKGLAIRFS